MGALVQLAVDDWHAERARLLQMLGLTLLGFAFLLAVLLFSGGLVLAATWDTVYRLPVLAGLVFANGLGLAVAWRHLQALAARGEASFATLRAALIADHTPAEYPRSLTVRWLIQRPVLATQITERVAGPHAAVAIPALLLLAQLLRTTAK